MPEPPIKRYALMPAQGDDGIRRFHLARVAHSSRTAQPADRLERMEQIVALERHDETGAPQPEGRYGRLRMPRDR